jgi:hypothetical protein
MKITATMGNPKWPGMGLIFASNKNIQKYLFIAGISHTYICSSDYNDKIFDSLFPTITQQWPICI